MDPVGWRKVSHKSLFRPIDKPILSLRLNADVIMYDEKVYFLSMAGENLFNMERSYKATCSYCVNDIVESGIITNIECFKNTAMSGSNPRRFVSFNNSYLERLKHKNYQGIYTFTVTKIVVFKKLRKGSGCPVDIRLEPTGAKRRP